MLEVQRNQQQQQQQQQQQHQHQQQQQQQQQPQQPQQQQQQKQQLLVIWVLYGIILLCWVARKTRMIYRDECPPDWHPIFTKKITPGLPKKDIFGHISDKTIIDFTKTTSHVPQHPT